MQGSRIDGRSAAVGIGSGQVKQARSLLGQRASTRHITAISSIIDLVKDNAGSIALQGSRIDGRSAVVGIGSGQIKQARSLLGQRANSRQCAGIGSISSLVEDNGGVIGDIALNAGSVALQGSRIDSRSAGVGIGSSQVKQARSLLNQTTRSADSAGKNRVVSIPRGQGVCIQADKAPSDTLQRADGFIGKQVQGSSLVNIHHSRVGNGRPACQ